MRSGQAGGTVFRPFVALAVGKMDVGEWGVRSQGMYLWRGLVCTHEA